MLGMPLPGVVDFYRGAALPNGTRLVDLWAWSDEALEASHDYIQWMFPLDMPSRANPSAPTLTEDDRRMFVWDDVLRDRLQISLGVMLRFFGLERVVVPPAEGNREGKVVILRARDFDRRRAVWLWPDHHNHRRLSRILRSLTILGHERDARALFACLDDIARTDGRDVVTFETREHWRRAVA
jgi:hypothetical protein